MEDKSIQLCEFLKYLILKLMCKKFQFDFRCAGFVYSNSSWMRKFCSASANFEYNIFQNQVKMDNAEKEPSKSSSICIAEETYHAPYARVSSMEDPSTRNSEYGKAAPTMLDTAAIGADAGKARVSDIRNATLEKIPEATEKPQVKESPKGFRRLLKFGKKSQSPTTRNVESDNVSIDGSEADEIGTNGSSNEGNVLLKGIIILKLVISGTLPLLGPQLLYHDPQNTTFTCFLRTSCAD
jgi:hypothetical protein